MSESPSAPLPPRPSLEHLKNQAKELLRAYRAADPAATATFAALKRPPAPDAATLAGAQRAVAIHYGFPTWSKLKSHVENLPAADPDPLQVVHGAFSRDNADAVRHTLARYPALKQKINEPLFPFDSPAIIHVRSRSMLDALLDNGADLNARSRWWAGGFGILDAAPPDVAHYAIQRGARVDAHSAARLGLLDTLRQLLDADPSLVHAPGGDGQTPLHFAATAEIADLLLDRGANINALDVDHESTPAQWMLRDRQPVAKHLVSRGCRTDLLMAAALGDRDRVLHHLDTHPDSIHTAVTEQYFPKRNPRAGGHIYIWTLGANKTAPQVAREFGHDDVFRLLMDRAPEGLKLAIACELGDEPTFRALLAARPDLVRTLDAAGRRKVADAAQNNNTDAVRLMLEAGWPVDARGQHNATPLHWAAFHGNAKMVEAILKHHPPLADTQNDFHAPPLGWATHGSEHGWHAATGDYVTTTRLLCAAGAPFPPKFSGTAAVKAVLRKFGMPESP